MSISICIVLVTSMVKGDVSYQSRVIYLLPVLVGIGAYIAAQSVLKSPEIGLVREGLARRKAKRG